MLPELLPSVADVRDTNKKEIIITSCYFGASRNPLSCLLQNQPVARRSRIRATVFSSSCAARLRTSAVGIKKPTST